MIVTKYLRIHGRVQGVGFRWSLCEQAQRLGVSGWVRNRGDGSVEALIRGPEEAVAVLAEWARHGPAGAHVLSIEVQAGDATTELAGFTQMPTV